MLSLALTDRSHRLPFAVAVFIGDVRTSEIYRLNVRSEIKGTGSLNEIFIISDAKCKNMGSSSAVMGNCNFLN